MNQVLVTNGLPAPAEPQPLLRPVEARERISSLDALRGFSLLGILLMNIVAFGLHRGAYDDPTVAGGAAGVNLWVWAVLHVLAEGKMRCIFSMVFGASMIVLTSRAEQRGGGTLIADINYRRLLWLMVFGIAHAYLLWFGDILYPYALCGLVLYPFRKLSPKALLIAAAILVILQAGVAIYQGFDVRSTARLAAEADAATAQGKKLTDEQEEAKKKWEEIRKDARPTAEDIRKDTEGFRGGFLKVIQYRATLVVRFHSTPYYHFWNWDIWSMMLIGMALMKLGVFSALWSYAFYAWVAVLGYAIGITVNSMTAWNIIQSKFDLAVRAFNGTTYDLGRLTVALAHMSLLMLLAKAGALRWLVSRLAAVGQMAFSNYIMHSLICSTLFCGYGFGLYARLERYQLYYVVFAIWIFQLIASPIWLRRYRFGPLEWCWRSLTYWKRQPFRAA